MRKLLVFVAFAFALAGMVFAQDAENDNFSNLDAPNAESVGVDSAEQRIKEVSIDKFESEGTWLVKMSADEGVIQSRLFQGAPANKKPLEAESGMNITDEKVLGVKASFYRRGCNSFEILAVKPLPVEGISKTVSVWVVGRSYPHTLKLIVEDFWGKRFELYVGKLNHAGWKLMTVAIPPQNTAAGISGIVQKDHHFASTGMGLKIVGFKVECDLVESYGDCYMYFDDLRVVSDLYEIDLRDKDDMADFW